MSWHSSGIFFSVTPQCINAMHNIQKGELLRTEFSFGFRFPIQVVTRWFGIQVELTIIMTPEFLELLPTTPEMKSTHPECVTVST